jgi:hypothetical protein
MGGFGLNEFFFASFAPLRETPRPVSDSTWAWWRKLQLAGDAFRLPFKMLFL